MKIILHDDHGGEHDITEHVRSLYGHTTGSMDWGSGFLSTEEELEVLEIGYLTGFEENDIDKEIEGLKRDLGIYQEKAEHDARRRYNLNVHYWAKKTAEKEAFLAGLERIRESRARLLALTEDVTGFDE